MLGKLEPKIYGNKKKKKVTRKTVTLVCEECGEEYLVCNYEKDKRKFCSRTCASRNFNKTRIVDRGTRICAYCGKEYELTYVNKYTKYCSKRCAGIHAGEIRAHDREVLNYE